MARIYEYNLYFDASGHVDKWDYLCVTGCASRIGQWRSFDERWKALLKKYKLPWPFHMTDFIAGREDKGYGYFKNQEEKQDAFCLEAIEIMRKTVRKCVSALIELAPFDAIRQQYLFPDGLEANDAYMWTAGLTQLQMVRWSQQHAGKDDRIKIIFAIGDKTQPQFLVKYAELYKLPPPMLTTPDQASPLQAADMLAWEHRTSVLYKKQGKPLRASYKHIQKLLSLDWKEYDTATLHKVCEEGVQQGLFIRKVPGTKGQAFGMQIVPPS